MCVFFPSGGGSVQVFYFYTLNHTVKILWNRESPGLKCYLNKHIKVQSVNKW